MSSVGACRGSVRWVSGARARGVGARARAPSVGATLTLAPAAGPGRGRGREKGRVGPTSLVLARTGKQLRSKVLSTYQRQGRVGPGRGLLC